MYIVKAITTIISFSSKRNLAECVIGLLADALGPGQFSDERVLGPTRAELFTDITLCGILRARTTVGLILPKWTGTKDFDDQERSKCGIR